MKTLSKYGVVLFAVYLAAWTASYAIMFAYRGDGWDFTYFFEYLKLAWTFRGGELPSLLWLFSIILFLPAAVLSAFLLRRHARCKDAD